MIGFYARTALNLLNARSTDCARKSLRRGVYLSLLGSAVNQGAILVANLILARALTKAEFGRYSLVQSTLLYWALLAQGIAGFSGTNKFISEHANGSKRELLKILESSRSITVASSVLFCTLLFCAAPLIGQKVFNDTTIVYAIRTGTIFMFFWSLNAYQLGALTGFKRFDSIARGNIYAGLVTVLMVSTFGARYSTLGAVIGLSFSAFYRFVYLKKEFAKVLSTQDIVLTWRQWAFDPGIMKGFAIPSAIGLYLGLCANWFAQANLARSHGGYEQMAVFAVALTFKSMLSFGPSICNPIFLSFMGDARSRGDFREYLRLLEKNLLVTLGFAVFGLFIILSFGAALPAMFGKKYVDGPSIIPIVFAYALLEMVTLVLYQHLQSAGKIWSTVFFLNLPRDLVLLACSFHLVRSSGSAGLAWSFIFAWLAALIGAVLLSGDLWKIYASYGSKR